MSIVSGGLGRGSVGAGVLFGYGNRIIATGAIVFPTVPLPSVGGYGAPRQHEQSTINDDDQVIMMVIKTFLDGQE